ncbi:MAG TPA: nucleotidyltransferase family protein [Solirubrobacteraceae bacterium]|nr:nucleotidyltransferase family protein [Solirubrobacteraceae bacterium]
MDELDRIWSRAEELAERAPGPADLRAHRLELVAAHRLRRRGDRPPAQLRDAERLAAVAALAAPVVLARARAAYDGPLVLMKGPEIAARYPDPALRPFWDVDLLVDDAPAAQRALLDAGFALAGRWPEVELHHGWPLTWPGLPIGVELHSAAHWPELLPAPPAAELLACAVPARCAGGVATLAPAQHTLVVAAHSWAHAPLACIGQLVDVALLAREADERELDALARRWGCARMWRTTRSAIDALLLGTRPPSAAMRLWARHLRAARERMLLEHHVEQLASPLWGASPPRAAHASARMLARRARPMGGETWARKLFRLRRAFANAGLRHSEHFARLPPEDRHLGGPTDYRDPPAISEPRSHV